jgi:hypothetical protein
LSDGGTKETRAKPPIWMAAQASLGDPVFTHIRMFGKRSPSEPFGTLGWSAISYLMCDSPGRIRVSGGFRS